MLAGKFRIDCPRIGNSDVLGMYKDVPLNPYNIRVTLGLYRDNGKENGNYYLGFWVYSPLEVDTETATLRVQGLRT